MPQIFQDSQTPGCSAAQTSFDTVSPSLMIEPSRSRLRAGALAPVPGTTVNGRQRCSAGLSLGKKMTVSGVGGVEVAAPGRDAGRKAVRGDRQPESFQCAGAGRGSHPHRPLPSGGRKEILAGVSIPHPAVRQGFPGREVSPAALRQNQITCCLVGFYWSRLVTFFQKDTRQNRVV